MVFVTLRFEDGTNPEAVQLQPDTIYRIGRKRELEFHSDDESLELAHATIALIAGGIVRIAAVAGKVLVNGSETEIQSISNSDIVNCLVDLKFGNVKAKLSFKEDKHDEAAHDSSGFEEETKDKSVDTTGDSFIIPETMPPPKEVCFDDDKELEKIQNRTVNNTSDSLVIPESMPPSANTTFDCDSFNIPETQAVPLQRQSKGPEVSKVSFDDDDFLIPETQEVLPQNPRPDLEHKANVVVDDDSSELGSQIRICTQEFNEFDEDAIDDFDSSLLLGDVAITVLGKGALKQPADNAAVDQEVSALNWSATNTKYSAVNSTKLDEEHARNEACLTPELSAAGIPLDDVPCTPDLFDFINNEANQSSNSPPHELINVTADVHRNSGCRAEKSPVNKSPVNTIETPDNTPGEANDNNEDFIETQAFPMRKLIANDDDVATQAFNRNASWNDNDDFIATQVSTSLVNTNLEDNIATQAFVRDPEVSKTKPKETEENNSNTSAFLAPQPKSTVNNSENFNNSNTSSPFKAPLAKSAVNDIANNSEDLIATQVFFKQPRVSETITKESTNSCININDDMQETQLFIPPKTADPNSSRLNISDCLSIGDELDHELKEFIALKSLPSSSEDEDFQFANSKCNTEKKEQNEISKEVANQSATTFSRKRLAVKVRDMSKSSTPITVESNDEKTPLATTKQHRKRSSTTNTKLTSPPKKQRSEENETLEYADEKTPLSSKMSRQAKSKSEAIVDQTASARSESDAKARLRKVKSNEKLDQAPSVRSESETKKGRPKRLKTTDEILHEKLDQAASVRSASETKKGRPKKLKSNDVILHETKDQAVSVRSESDTKRGRPSKLKTNDEVLHETKDQAASVRSASETRGQRSKKSRNTDESVPEKLDEAASSRLTSTAKTLHGKTSANNISKSRSEKSEIIQPIDQVAPPKRSKRLASLRTDSQLSEAAGSSNESTKETDVPPEKKVKKSKIESSSMPASETEVSSRSKSKKKTGKSESEPIFSDKAIASSSTPIAKSRDVAEKSTTATKVASKLDAARKPDGNTEVPSRSKSTKTTGKSDKVAKAEKAAPIAKAKDVAKTNPKDEEESATTLNNSRRKNNQQDYLQGINKYIMKIKRSGRKIQLSLSMCNYAELRQILYFLRNEFDVTDDPRCCDVLLMDRGERTYKFLIGIASNRPILSSCWLHDIKENRSLAVKSNHIFKDYKFMELFKFNPLAVLEPTNLLKGFNFMLGTDIQPNAKDMQAIIECAGGTVHRKAPPIASNVRLYVVASQKDKHMWQLLRNYTNLEYIKTEGVMQALVQHKPELLDEHKLIRL